jgi:hypothetical protein
MLIGEIGQNTQKILLSLINRQYREPPCSVNYTPCQKFCSVYLSAEPTQASMAWYTIMYSTIIMYSAVSLLLSPSKFLCVFCDETKIFQSVIVLLLSVQITQFQNWSVKNRLNLVSVSSKIMHWNALQAITIMYIQRYVR